MPADVGFWGAIKCLMGRHARSKGAAKAAPEGWVSKCVRCGIPMVRAHSGGKWLIVKAPLPKKGHPADGKASEALTAALARSRQGGQRREEKAILAAAKAAAKQAKAEQKAAEKADDTVPPRKRLFRRKAKDAVANIVDGGIEGDETMAEAKPKRGRRAKAVAGGQTAVAEPKRGFLRRKAKQVAPDDASGIDALEA